MTARVDFIKRKLDHLRCLMVKKTFKPVDMDKFHIILHDSRAGSTFFQEHLNCHPDNTELGEVFNRDKVVTKYYDTEKVQVNYLSHLVDGLHTSHKGCKISFPQIVRHVNTLEFLKTYKDAKFIIVERKNVVASGVSLLVAQKTGKYHTQKKMLVREKHYIDPIELKMLIDWRKAINNTIKNLLNILEARYCCIAYEDLIQNTDSVISGAFEFIGLSEFKSKSSYRKLNPKSLKNIIDNYREVKQYFNKFDEYVWFEG